MQMRAAGGTAAVSCARRGGVASLLVLLAVVAGCGTGAGAPERGAEMRIEWVLPAAFPAQVTLHRLHAGEDPGGGVAMRTYAAGETPALGEVIEGGRLRVELDRAETVRVAVRNPLDRPVRFWVAPHLPTPHHGEAALMVRCLCTGETYEVPSGGTWTRAVQFGVRRRGAVEAMVVTHVITAGEAPSLPGSAH